MNRKPISEADLVKKINEELSIHEDCNDCRVTGVMRLQGIDEAGCNWTDPALRCSGVKTDICLPVANQVISEMKHKYNLL